MYFEFAMHEILRFVQDDNPNLCRELQDIALVRRTFYETPDSVYNHSDAVRSVSFARLGSYVPGFPITGEHGEDHVIDLLTLEPETLDKVGLFPHPDSLH
jgi:hypothetical protein